MESDAKREPEGRIRNDHSGEQNKYDNRTRLRRRADKNRSQDWPKKSCVQQSKAPVRDKYVAVAINEIVNLENAWSVWNVRFHLNWNEIRFNEKRNSWKALLAKTLKRNKLLKTKIDINSSVIIISEPLLKQIGQPNQIIVFNKDVIAANNWKFLLNGQRLFKSKFRSQHLN